MRCERSRRPSRAAPLVTRPAAPARSACRARRDPLPLVAYLVDSVTRPSLQADRMTTVMRAIKEPSSPAVANLVERPSPLVQNRKLRISKHFLLTRQERRVFILLSDGLSNKGLALDSRSAELTVKSYVTAVLNKTGCRNRTQAAVLSLHWRVASRISSTPDGKPSQEQT